MRRAILLVVACASFGCGPRHVEPFTPRHRAYKSGDYAQEAREGRPQAGSLFSEARGGYLEDTRAHRVGDVVVVRIRESADAQGTSSTRLKKEGEGTTGAGALLGILPALKRAYPELDPTKLAEYASKSGFSGEGDTARKGELNGQISVRVTREMPNGDLFLEGTKVVLVNNEEYHLYISGLVRPTDISPDNSVASTRFADAQVEFTGRGDIADQQRKGWLARVVEAVNPF